MRGDDHRRVAGPGSRRSARQATRQPPRQSRQTPARSASRRSPQSARAGTTGSREISSARRSEGVVFDDDGSVGCLVKPPSSGTSLSSTASPVRARAAMQSDRGSRLVPPTNRRSSVAEHDRGVTGADARGLTGGTTVASTNGTRSVLSCWARWASCPLIGGEPPLGLHRVTPARSAGHRRLTRGGASASQTAFTIVGGDPTVAYSPISLAPIG
jgi:hypothetical protein